MPKRTFDLPLLCRYGSQLRSNLLRQRSVKIRKEISMPRQELGGVQPMRGKRCRRRRRKAAGHRARGGERYRRRFAAAVTAAHFPTLLPGRCARSVPILRMCSIPPIALPGAPRIVGALRRDTPLYPVPRLGHRTRTRRKSLPRKRKLSDRIAIV